MASGLRYRALSVGGTIAATAAVTTLVNTPAVQQAFSAVPYLGRPAPAVLSNGALSLALVTTVLAMLVSMWALFKPEPRRTLDTLLLAQKRVVIAFLALATLGYFDYSFRLPRSTLLLTAASLFVVLPLWMVVIRRRPARRVRAVLVGDDPETMRDLLDATDLPVIGYVAPPSPYRMDSGVTAKQSVADGGIAEFEGVRYLGGLSRLDEVIRDHDVDTVLVAFAESDRAEFFGTLATCHDYGVSVQAHRDHADQVLTQDAGAGPLVDIDLEPWDWQDHVVKRAFDVAFAGAALLVLSPVILVVAAAIKLDSSGPLFYSQERTAEFGETFTIHKFRSMVPEGENPEPLEDDQNDRITRVGRVLRRTHIDEVPQLWSILVGDMSVVGPRAAWREEEQFLEGQTQSWQKRWFVKPGLTGLAQIRDASSTEPDEKLRYDLTYIRRQSFWFDLKIVVRQVWMVLQDVYDTLLRN